MATMQSTRGGTLGAAKGAGGAAWHAEAPQAQAAHCATLRHGHLTTHCLAHTRSLQRAQDPGKGGMLVCAEGRVQALISSSTAGTPAKTRHSVTCRYNSTAARAIPAQAWSRGFATRPPPPPPLLPSAGSADVAPRARAYGSSRPVASASTFAAVGLGPRAGVRVFTLHPALTPQTGAHLMQQPCKLPEHLHLLRNCFMTASCSKRPSQKHLSPSSTVFGTLPTAAPSASPSGLRNTKWGMPCTP